MQPVEAQRGTSFTLCMWASTLTPFNNVFSVIICDFSDAFSVRRGFSQKPTVRFSEGVSEQQEQTATHYWSVATNPCFGHMWSVLCVCVLCVLKY